MTNGEFVAGTPTSLSLIMVGSNLSSNVIAGVGVSELVTSSTPSDRSGPRRHPARAAARIVRATIRATNLDVAASRPSADIFREESRRRSVETPRRGFDDGAKDSRA
jgi:hypothetical protein